MIGVALPGSVMCGNRSRQSFLGHRLWTPSRAPAADTVKAELKDYTDAAIAQGVFGVPTCELDASC